MTEKKKTTFIFTNTINIYDDLDLSLDDSFDSNLYAKTIVNQWNDTANVSLESSHPTEEITSQLLEKQDILEEQKFEESTDSFFRNLANQHPESSDISIIDKIGEGGMGTVLLGQQKIPQREVAIKRLKKPSRLLCRLLIEEAMIMGALEHPNIIPVHAVSLQSLHGPEVIMKCVQGENLQELICTNGVDYTLPNMGGLRKTINILIQVCHAIEYAHSKGIYHRDIKPENIMVGEFGEVYLLDWGIALNKGKSIQQSQVLSNSIVGTPAYMPPEMLTGAAEDVSQHTDVFLLGATLYHIITGKVLYSGNDIDEVINNARICAEPQYHSSIPNELRDICTKALQKNKELRYQSMTEMREELELFLQRVEAYRLRDKSVESLRQLEIHIEQNKNPSLIPPDVYQYFSEARFGFEQALRIVKDCSGCNEYLQKTLELMISLHLDINDLNSAQILLLSLPQKNPELEHRAEQVSKYLKERVEKEEQFKKLEAKYDQSHSHKERLWLARSLGISIPILILCALVYDYMYHPPVTPQRLLFSMGSLFFIVLFATIVGRRTLLINATGRRAVIALGSGSFGFILTSLMGIKYQLDGNIVMMIDQLIVAITFACVYPVIQTAGYISLAGLGAFLISLFLPEYTHKVLLLLGLITVHYTLRDWSREDWGSETE